MGRSGVQAEGLALGPRIVHLRNRKEGRLTCVDADRRINAVVRVYGNSLVVPIFSVKEETESLAESFREAW